MKISRRQLRKLILQEMAHMDNPMRQRSKGKFRSLGGAPLGAESSIDIAGTEELEDYMMLSGPYEHDIRDEYAYEGMRAQEEAFEEYLKILRALESENPADDRAYLMKRRKKINDTWGFDDPTLNESSLTRTGLRKLIIEAMVPGEKLSPEGRFKLMINPDFRGTEYMHVDNPNNYVVYDDDGEEVRTQDGDNLFRFRRTLDALDHYRFNPESVIDNDRFMQGLRGDVNWSATNAATIKGIKDDDERIALKLYLDHMKKEIGPHRESM